MANITSISYDTTILPFTSMETQLTWENVLIALAFILFETFISGVLKIGIGGSLLISAIRCMVQLTLVAMVLQKVFASEDPWVVAGITFLLNLLGTIEIVINKSKRRYQYMFPSVLVAMLGSTIPVSIIGTKFAMGVDPFWTPIQYIPIVGMLCGATISGITVSVSYVLKELQENRDKVEVYLAFGASRIEACRPVAIEALRLALTPTINNMSVLGIIAIPGMMTGAILGGSSVQQAARLQMIIVFMISASTTLAATLTTFVVIFVTVDNEHRIRGDRIYSGKIGFVRFGFGGGNGIKNGRGKFGIGSLGKVGKKMVEGSVWLQESMGKSKSRKEKEKYRSRSVSESTFTSASASASASTRASTSGSGSEDKRDGERRPLLG